MITLGFLERLEKLLRERHGRPDLQLCEYFDLIGGTSVGATLAAGLAIGKDTTELQAIAREALKVFKARRWKKWHSLFSADPLKAVLARQGKGRTLDDPSIKTGLCVIAKRADTRSTWPVTNHPHGRYFEKNRHIKLQDLVYASAAAPVFFVPTRFEVGDGEVGAFVDGGVSMVNNPALQLFLMATLDGYPFHWKTGEDNLLLVSIGTGTFERRDSVRKVMSSRAWDWTIQVPTMLMEDASVWNQMLLQLLSRSPTPWLIDEEVGSLENDLIAPEPALSYLRYDARVTPIGLAQMGLPELTHRIGWLHDMTNYDARDQLLDIGRRSATQQMRPEHFPHHFDLIS
jgi:hypothetical protein